MSRIGINVVKWGFTAPITSPSGGPDTSLDINGSTPVSTAPDTATRMIATYTSFPGTGQPWTLASQPTTFGLVSGGTIAVPESGVVT